MNDTQALPGRGIKPLTSLLAHPRLAVAVLLLVLLAGVPLAWHQGAPRYRAEATLQVAPRYMRNLREDPELDFQSNSQYRQFVEHQRQSIVRDDVLRDALARLGEHRALWQKPGENERRAIERLREQLQLWNVSDTYLLRVALEGPAPEGLAELVNAVTATFIDRMRQEQLYGADERSTHLRERERHLLAQIDRIGQQRSAIARELGLTTFNEATPNPYDQLLAAQRERLSEARQRRQEADAALASFRTRGDTQISVRSVQDAVQTDPGLNSLKAALNNRRAVLLTQISGLKPDHPGHAAATRELAEIDAELSGQGDRLESGVRRNLLARLQGTAEQAAQVEQGLEREHEALQSRATGFARLFQEAMAQTADIKQARSELDQLRERLNTLDVEATSFGFLRLVTAAQVPDMPYGPGRKKLLLAVLLAAFGGAVAAPVLRDLLDRRIHTVNDAERLVGVPSAGWQVARSDTASQVFADEQLRRLASALMRSHARNGQALFGFSACKPGAGTTSLVLELAMTMRTLGCKVLVVEANGLARDPRFDSQRPGLLELLRGQATGGQVIAPATPVLPPRVAISGGGEPGRVTLERFDRLGAALRHWAGIADFVLVDMPPLLSSADAELLVRTVGHVLLVVEAGGVTRGEVQRATRLLQALEPEAVGLVVNRVAPFDGGGYLRDLMLESISGRRADAVYSLPRWRLLLAAMRLPRLPRRSPPVANPDLPTP